MRCRLLIVILLLINRGLSGQDATHVLAFADSLYVNGDYEHAATEYQRVHFFSDDVQVRRTCINMRAKSLMNSQSAIEAIHLLQFQGFVADSLGRELAITRLQCQLKLGMWDSVILAASNLARLDKREQNRYRFYGFLALYEKKEIDKAVVVALTLTDTIGRQNMQHAYRQYRKSLRKPGLAFGLSIIPGTGQFYAGDVGNGFNSLVINAGTVGLSYWQFKSEKLLGIYLLATLFPRYYLGGMKNAAKSAEFRNNKARTTLYKTILTNIKFRVNG